MTKSEDALHTPEQLLATFAGFDVLGNDRLSTKCLYRDGFVKAIVEKAPSVPASEFDNDAPDTALFNFYLHTMALAQEVDAVSGKLFQARYGEDSDGNDAVYPMTDASRIGALLTNLTLHRAVEPFSDDGLRALLQLSAGAGIEDTSTIIAVCNAVNWCRGLMVNRYRSFVRGTPTYPVHDTINDVRDTLAGMGQGGDYIGFAMGFTVANLLVILASAESGKLSDNINYAIKMSQAQADSFSDERILEVLLGTIVRRYFGALGGWQHWPKQDGDLGKVFAGSIPARLRGGLLMRWDDATVVPFFWDWYKEHEVESPQYIMSNRHFYWGKKHQIAVAMYSMV